MCYCYCGRFTPAMTQSWPALVCPSQYLVAASYSTTHTASRAASASATTTSRFHYAQILDKLKDTYAAELKETPVDDLTFIRFVRGYVNEPDQEAAALKMFGDMLKWRKEMKVDEIAATKYDRKQMFVEKWPHGFHGISKDGHVVYIDRPGIINPDELHSTFSMEEYTLFHIQTMEHLNDLKVRLSQKTGKPNYKHVAIMDLEGFSLKHFGKKMTEPTKKLIELDQTKYPETLSKMLVVNAPFYFRAVWAIVSPFLDPITKTRIKVCLSHHPTLVLIDVRHQGLSPLLYLHHMSFRFPHLSFFPSLLPNFSPSTSQFCDTKELKEYVDPSQLPDFLGGDVKYTPEKPAFVTPFKSGGQYDDIFVGLLEGRQARQAAKTAGPESKSDAPTATTTSATDNAAPGGPAGGLVTDAATASSSTSIDNSNPLSPPPPTSAAGDATVDNNAALNSITSATPESS